MINSNPSIRKKSLLIGLCYTLFCFALIALLAFIANLFLENYGWIISIGIANIVFLVILRLIDVERLVGTDTIEKYWAKVKEGKIDLLLSNCKAKKATDKIILTGCVKDIYRSDLEKVTKSAFISEDTKGFVAGFKNDTLNLILLCTFLLAISYFGNIDFTSVYKADPTWNKEAINTIGKLKNSIEVTVLISSVIIQLAFLLRTPFLLDLRNRAYIVANNCDKE